MILEPPVAPERAGGATGQVTRLVVAVGCALLIAAMVDTALAQSPFGVGGPAPAQAPSLGIVGWILAKQSEFYRQLAGLIRASKADGSAVWSLLGLSFAYGVFHAAGPGHGKAVISSYLVANEETWRRGIVLSFASAMLQALVAVLIVGIAAALLGATAKVMGDTVRVIEIVSYALVASIGARLVWVKGRGFLNAWRALRAKPVALGAAVTPSGHLHDGDAHHHHDHDAACAHDHHHHDHHDHADSAWSHAHGPEPAELAGAGGWKRGLSAIVAVGLRPCSGAILVLVFALAQGMLLAGVGATFVMGLGTAVTVAAIATLAVGAKAFARGFAETRAGYGTLLLRGIEVGAAALVLVFGVALLAGYMASERIVGV